VDDTVPVVSSTKASSATQTVRLQSANCWGRSQNVRTTETVRLALR